MEPGLHDLGYRSTVDGSWQPYRVWVPARWRRRRPVVVCLHGYGGRCGDWPAPARRWADALGWLLLAPDGRGNQHWDHLGEDDVFEALADLARRVAVDPERIHLHGGSMGGHGALRLALRHPHRFAGVSAVAGWLTAEQFYPKWYAPAGEPEPPQAIAHLVAAAAPLNWLANGETLGGRLAWGTADRINEPVDQEWLVARLARLGWLSRWRTRRVSGGEHGAGHHWGRVFAALRPLRRVWPRRQRSLTLRHADGGWYRAERLVEPFTPADFAVEVGPELRLRLENVAEVTYDPRQLPRAWRRPRLRLESPAGVVEVAGDKPLTVDLVSAGAAVVKRRGLDGPIGEFFRAPFQVLAPVAGPQREAAERFCADWNAWFRLRWRGEPEEPGRPWWRTPYPWPPGAAVDATDLLRPEPFAAARDDRGQMLFGETSEPLWRRLSEWPGPLPFRPTAEGVVVGDQRFEGPRIGFWGLLPRPWRPDRLLLVCRGYQHSGIDPAEWGPGALGKDLERLPWQYPDLVVWDADRPLRPTVQPPLRHLPDAWLLAATFGPRWDWSGARRWRR